GRNGQCRRIHRHVSSHVADAVIRSRPSRADVGSRVRTHRGGTGGRGRASHTRQTAGRRGRVRHATVSVRGRRRGRRSTVGHAGVAGGDGHRLPTYRHVPRHVVDRVIRVHRSRARVS